MTRGIWSNQNGKQITGFSGKVDGTHTHTIPMGMKPKESAATLTLLESYDVSIERVLKQGD